MPEPQTGVADWQGVDKYGIWLAGRWIGTEGTVSIRETVPGGGGGIQAPRGFHPQSAGPSPKASTGADPQSGYEIDVSPELDRTTYWMLRSLVHQGRVGANPLFWQSVYPRVDAWVIRPANRKQWTLSGTITGTGGVVGVHEVPTVEVRSTGGVVVATSEPAEYPGADPLTIVPGAPGAGEVQIPSTSDVTQVVTGDLSAYAGMTLLVNSWSLVQVRILSAEREQGERRRISTRISVVETPEQRAYEDDT